MPRTARRSGQGASRLARDPRASKRDTNWDGVVHGTSLSGEDFDLLRYDLERSLDLDHALLGGAPRSRSMVEGRGGAAVWRARREIAIRAVAEWLMTPGAEPLHAVDPPGWLLRAPDGWVGVHLNIADD